MFIGNASRILCVTVSVYVPAQSNTSRLIEGDIFLSYGILLPIQYPFSSLFVWRIVVFLHTFSPEVVIETNKKHKQHNIIKVI